jgi:IstB-like ATP binding protein
MLTKAMLDRILHYSTIVNIKGESFRLKDRLEAPESSNYTVLIQPFAVST